ncbi:MAG TPA: DUF3306 domain-containing protein [Thermohalobaculum sp.]|nr:DUF3306 domain-containing protein [Thermohalobaculum sp.]
MSRRPKEGEADFLSRWSRRKQDARHAPAEAEDPAAPAPAGTDPAPERPEAEILEELGLPDPETLGPGSDFRAFMAEAVPEFIRRKALRRLWGTNPVLANLDMLVDYGEDYTDKARVVANLQTAYRAGRGYLDRFAGEAEPEAPDARMPRESAAPEASAAEGGDEPEAPAPDQPGEPPAPPEGEADAAVTRAPEDPGERECEHAEHAEGAPDAPPRRRMRFDFDVG